MVLQKREWGLVGKPSSPELLEGAPLARLLPAVDDEIIKEDAEVAGGHLPGIEEPDGARRGVAGVGEEGLARFLALPVDLAEGREREVDLAADLDLAVGLDDERQGADGLDVAADVVAPDAVAARDGPGELALAIDDGDAEAVDLELGRVGDVPAGEELAHALVELADLVLVVAVLDAHHRAAVDDGGEALDGLLADPLRRRFGRHEVGEAGLEVAELAHEAVELRVGDLGVVVDVVLALVVEDLPAQRLGPGAVLRPGGRGGHVFPPSSIDDPSSSGASRSRTAGVVSGPGSLTCRAGSWPGRRGR